MLTRRERVGPIEQTERAAIARSLAVDVGAGELGGPIDVEAHRRDDDRLLDEERWPFARPRGVMGGGPHRHHHQSAQTERPPDGTPGDADAHAVDHLAQDARDHPGAPEDHHVERGAVIGGVRVPDDRRRDHRDRPEEERPDPQLPRWMRREHRAQRAQDEEHRPPARHVALTPDDRGGEVRRSDEADDPHHPVRASRRDADRHGGVRRGSPSGVFPSRALPNPAAFSRGAREAGPAER